MNNRYKRHAMGVAAVAFGLAGLALGSNVSQAQERLSIGTSSTGSNPYVVGSTIAGELNQDAKDLALSVQTTGGYNENLGLVATNDIDLGMAFLFDGVNAYQGDGRFADLPNKEIFQDLRLVFPISISTYHYAALENSNIRNLDDILGKRFNVNVPSTSSRSIHEALIHAMGHSDSDYTIMELSSKDSYDGLRDGIVDAIGESSPVGGGPMLELTTSVAVHQIGVPDDIFEKLNTLYKNTLVRVTIPANTYENQPDPVRVFGATASLFANKAVSEDKIYAFTKAYWQNWDGLCKKNKAFCELPVDIAAQERLIPFHPGAARYFREIGLLK